MRTRSILSAAALAAGLLITPVTVGIANASAVATACQYRRVGNHWNCITPGAFCPAAAHGKLGYAKVTGQRYRCVKYSNGRWRWKRVVATPPPRSTPPPSGNDPRFSTCAEANRNGYGPYRVDVDPEYRWYQDRDGDGVVCER